jgi:hypothetical protein
MYLLSMLTPVTDAGGGARGFFFSVGAQWYRMDRMMDSMIDDVCETVLKVVCVERRKELEAS